MKYLSIDLLLLFILVLCAVLKHPFKIQENFKDNYDTAMAIIQTDKNIKVSPVQFMTVNMEPANSTLDSNNAKVSSLSSSEKSGQNLSDSNSNGKEEKCAFCDCAKLQGEIDNQCSSYQIDLAKCNIRVMEMQGACENEKNLIINKATTEKMALNKENNDLQSLKNTLQMSLIQCKQDNKTLVDQNKSLMSDNLDLRKNIYAYQKQIYECLRPQKPTCRSAQTNFGPDAGGEDGKGGGLFWLQLHGVSCNEKENLQKWHLVRDDKKNVAINYTCCKMEASGEPYPNKDMTEVPPVANATSDKNTKNNYPTS